MKRTLLILAVFLASCTASAAVSEPLKDAHLRRSPQHFGLYVTPGPKTNLITQPAFYRLPYR